MASPLFVEFGVLGDVANRKSDVLSRRAPGFEAPASIPSPAASTRWWVGWVTGHLNKQIAYDIGISEVTVKVYRGPGRAKGEGRFFA
jgi:hypothetical protein